MERWRTKGRCPGALEPMESGDGLILRIRPHGSALSQQALLAISDVSSRYGNGAIDLTRRANLQIRGLSPDTLSQALAALDDAGLLDPSAAIESVRNIVVSPLAGIDPASRIAGLRIAEALEAGLAGDPGLQRLPSKFSFLVDDGGRLPLGDVAASIRIEADGSDVRLSVGGDGRSAAPVALVDEASAAEAALALARAFLSRGVKRMGDLIADGSLPCLVRAAGLPRFEPLARFGKLRIVERGDLYGPQSGYRGVGAPFGSLGAATLADLAALSPAGVRLTPWRALLLPDFPPNLDAALGALTLVTRADDARLAVAACPGAPGCSSGEAPTRDLAQDLAPSSSLHGLSLHVSGCAKGCAHDGRLPFTLVGRNGLYDLVLNGRAFDTPTLRGLSRAGAIEALSTHRRALAS